MEQAINRCHKVRQAMTQSKPNPSAVRKSIWLERASVRALKVYTSNTGFFYGVVVPHLPLRLSNDHVRRRADAMRCVTRLCTREGGVEGRRKAYR